MVSKKAKSKRLSTRHRVKVQRKVREHHRKVRKEIKKMGHKQSSSSSRNRKDPGIPNLWPFKEELLKRIEEHKQSEKRQHEKKPKMERLVQHDQKTSPATVKESLSKMVKEAEMKTDQFENSSSLRHEESDGKGVWSNDSSKQSYFRELKKVIEMADVILEVLDARDPQGCRCLSLERRIVASSSQKRLILVLNKIDLVPKEVVERWLKCLREEFPTVAFKASTQSQRHHIGQTMMESNQVDDSALNSSACLGGSSILTLLKNYCRNLNIKTSIRVGVVGYPNVGKSSLINSLKRSKVCGVAATPGFTKTLQEIHLDKHIRLIDCPGIVFADIQDDDKGLLLLRNCMRLDQLKDPIEAVNLVLKRCCKEDLMKWYSISTFHDALSFLEQLARLRGKLKKGGAPDLVATAKAVLHDWNIGKLTFYTLPPTDRKHEVASTIVHEWAKEFHIDSIEHLESVTLDSLKSQSGMNGCAIETQDMSDNGLDHELSWQDNQIDAHDHEIIKDTMIDEDHVPSKISDVKLLAINNTKKDHSQEKSSSGKMFNIEDEEEARLNPQINRQRKKLLKQLQKDKRRDPSMNSNQIMDIDGDYDFSTDFDMIPPAESMEETSVLR